MPVAVFAGLLAAIAVSVDYLVAPVAALVLWTGGLVIHQPPGMSVVNVRPPRPLQVSCFAFATLAVAATLDLFPVAALAPTLAALLVASATTLALAAAHRLRRTPTRALLVGDMQALDLEARALANQPGVEVIGACMPAAGGMSAREVATAVVDCQADIVIVVPGPNFAAPDLQRLAWELEGTSATILVGGVIDRLAPHRLSVGTFAGRSVVAVGSSRPGRIQSAIKSVFDRVVGTLLLVLASPLMLLMAAAVRLDSRGPALFKQKRVGRDGRPFQMYKMRTMRVQDEVHIPMQLERTAGNEVLFKMRDDPRVTRVGRLLRRLSADEIPQLINVVRGEMSLIGPRPALYEETIKYDDHAWRRTAIKPGITGLWQVSGRSDLSWEQSIRLDVHYVDNWRFRDDLRILAKTLWAVGCRKGAY